MTTDDIEDNNLPDDVMEGYYPVWRNARLKFMADNPATSAALALKEPPETYAEYRRAMTTPSPTDKRNGQ